jgi:hypothetical protein
MIDLGLATINEKTAWGLLNCGLALNFGVIGTRLLIRAARDAHNAGARILYGVMFLVIAVFFGLMAGAWIIRGDSSPSVGLVGLAIMWLATTAAVVYLVFWRREAPAE